MELFNLYNSSSNKELDGNKSSIQRDMNHMVLDNSDKSRAVREAGFDMIIYSIKDTFRPIYKAIGAKIESLCEKPVAEIDIKGFNTTIKANIKQLQASIKLYETNLAELYKDPNWRDIYYNDISSFTTKISNAKQEIIKLNKQII